MWGDIASWFDNRYKFFFFNTPFISVAALGGIPAFTSIPDGSFFLVSHSNRGTMVWNHQVLEMIPFACFFCWFPENPKTHLKNPYSAPIVLPSFVKQRIPGILSEDRWHPLARTLQLGLFVLCYWMKNDGFRRQIFKNVVKKTADDETFWRQDLDPLRRVASTLKRETWISIRSLGFQSRFLKPSIN